jgi:DNA modification methylase
MKGVHCSWVDMLKIREALSAAERGGAAGLAHMRCVKDSTVSQWRSACTVVDVLEGKVQISELSHFQPSHATEIATAFRAREKDPGRWTPEIKDQIADWVDRCEAEKLTVRKLRQELRAALPAPRAPVPGVNGSEGVQPWNVIEGEALATLSGLCEGGARLVFADPPYNIGIDYGDGEDADRLPDADYLAWCAEWFTQCRRVLTGDGSLWVLICDEYAAEYGVALKAAGFTVRNWIKWYETFGVNCANKFNRCSRHLFYCVKDPDRFVFHREAVSRPSDRLAKYNDARANPAGKLLDDVWTDIPRLAGTHAERLPDFPTQLPLALLRRVVLCASDPGDLVIDPFNGSGTTGAAAVESGRRYLGIEKEARFAEAARQRLKGVARG